MYLPFASVILNVFNPVAGTLVLTFTPFPFKWKLWMLDLSLTTSVYLPAFVGFFMLIVKPGPTVPVTFGVAAKTGIAAIAPIVRARSTAMVRFLMILLECRFGLEEGSQSGLVGRRETRRLDGLPRERVVVGAG